MLRFSVLCLLLLAEIAVNAVIIFLAPQERGPLQPFMSIWMASFVPYFAACFLILKTKAPDGRRRWIELALILIGAFFLRFMLLPLAPNLSPDSWRYVWDAKVTLHGFSPYVYVPNDPQLLHLRDTNYDHIFNGYRGVPTIYPPVAQGIYILSYLLVPGSLFALKTFFMFFDLLSCSLLMLLLQRRGLDPARSIIYAWCPLPVVEFAMQGHVDVVAITFMLLAVLATTSRRRGTRALTGLWLGLSTLAKIYPLVFLMAVAHRHNSRSTPQNESSKQAASDTSPPLRSDNPLRLSSATPKEKRGYLLLLNRSMFVTAGTCLATITLGYLPFLLLGHGQAFGFFTTYVGEQSANSGPIQQIADRLARALHLTFQVQVTLVYLISLCIGAGAFLTVLRLRLQDRISVEAAIPVLIGTLYVFAPHIYPWYTAALLPWIALLVQPLFTRKHGLSARGLAVAAAWYFPCMSILSYFFIGKDWTLYYPIVYIPVMIVLGIAAIRNWQCNRLRAQSHSFRQQHITEDLSSQLLREEAPARER